MLALKRQRAHRRRRRLVAAGLLCLLACVSFAASLRRGLESPRPSKMVLDRRGRYLGEVPGEGGELGYWPLPDALPERVVRATLETEDRFFFEHRGVRLRSVLRAAWQNARNLRTVSGASTVAMQVARLQSPGRRSLLNKAREAAEALLLVRDHGHERVLRQYLTLAPYGHRVHGVARAARYYFDKPVEDLSWLQAAFLAGLPQMPGRMNPHKPEGLARATRRAHRILRTLRARGVITDAELAQALGGDPGLVPRPERSPAALHAVLELTDRARRRPGAVSTSTLDLDLQQRAAGILRAHLEVAAQWGVGNGAALVVDLPSGEVLAHVGSRDYFDAEARGALDYVRTRRSPGSALKPFLYALAIEQGRTAADELPDVPAEYELPGGAWLPENFNHGWFGPLLLREALANSRNLPALRIAGDVGVEPALRFFERAGVREISWEPGRYGLGIALGALPVTLEELAGLYGVLAREGETLPLRRLADDPAVPVRRVLSRDAARLVRHILSDPSARRPTFPVGGPLDYADYAVAVKTGTSQGYRDAWTVAFSDRLLVGAWVGNHDTRRMAGVAGARAALLVHELIDAFMPERSPHRAPLPAFPPPEGWVGRAVCALSGRLAGPGCPASKVEHFPPGAEPWHECPWHVRVRIDRRNGLRAGPSCPERFVEERAMLDLPDDYARWARQKHLEIAPREPSPLCPETLAREAPVDVRIREPRPGARYLWDPETPTEASTVRFSARVSPPDEELVWIVDGVPVARVRWPHELRWSLGPGRHTVAAALARRAGGAGPVTVMVDD